MVVPHREQSSEGGIMKEKTRWRGYGKVEGGWWRRKQRDAEENGMHVREERDRWQIEGSAEDQER